VSGADAVTEGNHGGYIARTQPNTKLQGQVYGKWVVSRKEWKRVALMTLQTPFAVPFGDNFTATVKSAGLTVTDSLIYEDKKASYRSEITRVLATNPELIMLLGYTPDSVVMAKELFRAAYKGAVLGPAFAINAKFVEGAGAEVAEACGPSIPRRRSTRRPTSSSPAAVPQADKNPYAPQSWDHMTLVGLALAAHRGEASGTAIKDTLRTISNPPGTAVTSYEDGARLLAEGKKINYEGASGSCDFDAIGDILSRPFGAYQVRKGKIEQAATSIPERMPPIAQYLFNGLVTGGILALPAVAFSVLWKLLRFPNFAVSTYLTIGAFAAFAVNHGAGWRIAWAWLFALAVTGTIAWAVDRVAFRPMRDRRPFALAIASIGVSFVLENAIRFIWGNDYRSYDVPVTRALVWHGLRVGREQLAILGVTVASSAWCRSSSTARGSASPCAPPPTTRSWPGSRACPPSASPASRPSAAARSPAAPASSSGSTRPSTRCWAPASSSRCSRRRSSAGSARRRARSWAPSSWGSRRR
jgi:ABC-type branched-subunit amino acid transport system substrate-binding protein